MAWSKEFTAGVRAEEEGCSRNSNPHSQSLETHEWHEWDNGWCWSHDSRWGDPMGDHNGRNK